jgi:hypothetical protein
MTRITAKTAEWHNGAMEQLNPEVKVEVKVEALNMKNQLI